MDRAKSPFSQNVETEEQERRFLYMPDRTSLVGKIEAILGFWLDET